MALYYTIGTKLALVPGLKQLVLIGGGRMTLFLAVCVRAVCMVCVRRGHGVRQVHGRA